MLGAPRMTQTLKRHTDTVRWLAIAAIGVMAQAVCADAPEMQSIEVFTTSDRPVIGIDHALSEATNVTVYLVDGLERFEAQLSSRLPRHPTQARSEALRRIQQLTAGNMVQARQAAVGLAEAMQYGIDRYPAIVFDGHAVVYGAKDFAEALERYYAWRRVPAR